MSRMISQLFMGSELTLLPLIGLAAFMLVFVGNFARVYAKKAHEYDTIARLPLDSDGDPK